MEKKGKGARGNGERERKKKIGKEREWGEWGKPGKGKIEGIEKRAKIKPQLKGEEGWEKVWKPI